MRKLRRLPWRIPKSHDKQPAAASSPSSHVSHASQFSAAVETFPRFEAVERRPTREELNTQPVAFAGGRYVYGDAPSVTCSTEIRRKARHRVVLAGA